MKIQKIPCGGEDFYANLGCASGQTREGRGRSVELVATIARKILTTQKYNSFCFFLGEFPHHSQLI